MNKLRRTKIICTIGPASDSEEMIGNLIDAGMNCARINCSHGGCETRRPLVERLHKVRRAMGAPVAIMLDTKGPEFRIDTFKEGYADIKDGSTFVFTLNKVDGDETQVSVFNPEVFQELHEGDIILANDGLVKFQVLENKGDSLICKTLIGGLLSDHKSLNFPGKHIKIDYLSDADKNDLLFAIENKVDYVACSFVSCEEDIVAVEDFLLKNGGINISLIAKIENQAGIDNLKSICKHVDGIMVARGDLGVEIDYDLLPMTQKKIIRKCIKLGKLVVTSTEMLESMIEHPRPTRAEISDIANAIVDGTSALMLSGETAIGKYPVESVEAMSKIAKSTEQRLPYIDYIKKRNLVVKGRTVDAIAHATCAIAVDVEAKGIVNITESGFTSELISNFRPHVDCVAITSTKRECYRLSLYWGINPIFRTLNPNASNGDIVTHAKNIAQDLLGLEPGDKFVLNSGFIADEIGYTNAIMVETI